MISTFTVLYTPLAARLVVRRDREASNALYWRTAACIVTIWVPIFALTLTAARRRSPRPRRPLRRARHVPEHPRRRLLAVRARADSDSLSAARAEAIREAATILVPDIRSSIPTTSS